MRSEVFRAAAEKVKYGKDNFYYYSCIVLSGIAGDTTNEEHFYNSIFELKQNIYIDGVDYGWWGKPTKRNQLARQLALLFAAEMVDDEKTW